MSGLLFCCFSQADDIERFMFFSRAALEFMLMVNKQPDVVHLHDWQSAAVVRRIIADLGCTEQYNFALQQEGQLG